MNKAPSGIYTISNAKALDKLINSHPDADFYHTPLWSQMLEGAGLGKVHYLLINDIAVVPVCVGTQKMKEAYIWGDFGHPLFLHYFIKEGEFKELILSLRKFALYSKIFALYINLPDFIVRRISSKYIRTLIPEYVVPRLRIESRDIEEAFKKLNKKRRNNIRKAIKQGLEVREASTLNDVKEYYKMYLNRCLQKI
jgi:hypothetical protein